VSDQRTVDDLARKLIAQRVRVLADDVEVDFVVTQVAPFPGRAPDDDSPRLSGIEITARSIGAPRPPDDNAALFRAGYKAGFEDGRVPHGFRPDHAWALYLRDLPFMPRRAPASSLAEAAADLGVSGDQLRRAFDLGKLPANPKPQPLENRDRKLASFRHGNLEAVLWLHPGQGLRGEVIQWCEREADPFNWTVARLTLKEGHADIWLRETVIEGNERPDPEAILDVIGMLQRAVQVLNGWTWTTE